MSASESGLRPLLALEPPRSLRHEAAVSRPHWARPVPGLWSAAALAAYVALYGSWQIVGWGPSAGRAHLLTGDFLCYPVDVAAVVATWWASRRVTAVPRLRRAWRWLCLGSLTYLLGDVSFTVYDSLGVAAYPSVADWFYLLFYPLMMAGLLSFPVAKRSLRETVRLWMDILIVALAFSTVVFYVTLAPNLEASQNLWQTVISVAYPIGDMVLLAGVSSVLVHGPGASARLPLRVLAVGLALYVAGDLIYGYESLNGTYQAGNAVDTTWIVTLGLIAVAAFAQRPLARLETVEPGRERVGGLPFLATALGFGILVYSQRHDSPFPGLAVTVLAMLVAALLALRLYVGQRDLLGAQGELTYQALHDDLTGLPNRALLFDRLEQTLARCEREGAEAAVLLLDVDDFKLVNDSLGHEAGDALLNEIAARMNAVARMGETVARLGGDEFAVIAEGCFDEAAITALAERIMSAFADPFTVGEQLRPVSGSLGIALGRDGNGPADLLRDADTAMYQAKAAGKGRYDVFDRELREQLLRRVELRAALNHAIEADELELVYQPIVALADGTTIAVETLVRWRHPGFGVVAPEEFIPLAEKSGLIVPLGRWVLDRAAAQSARWRSEHPGRLPNGVGVNISPRELDERDFAARVAETFARHGLTTQDLALELTEGVFIDDDKPTVAANLAALSASGVRLVLDDFGSGYSALASLKRFPLQALKIDRFFVDAIRNSDDDAPVIRAVVGLGRALGMKVTAEGVETAVQLAHLRAVGVDHVQGFLTGKPQTAEVIGSRLEREPDRPAVRAAHPA